MKKIKSLISILLIVFLIGISTNVYAETDETQSLTFTPVASTTELKEGQEVIITLKVSDINMGEDGINTFGGKLVYDETIFETVKSSDFSTQNNWSITYNDENTDKKGTFLAAIFSGATTDQTIGTVTLKVKSKVKSTSTKIQFTELSSVGTDEVALEDKIIELNVTGTATDGTDNEGNSNVDTDTNSNIIINTGSDDSNSGSNSGTSKSVSGSKDTTTSGGTIPQTGIVSIGIITAIAVLAIVAIFAYMKFKKMRDIK